MVRIIVLYIFRRRANERLKLRIGKRKILKKNNKIKTPNR